MGFICNMKNSVILLISVLFFISCEDVKHPDMDKTIQELKSRKIVRISDEQINAEAEKIKLETSKLKKKK